jgi:ABC-type antimicrobial peptide transport system permease subunit
VTTMDQVISDSIARPRLHAALMGLFAASAVVLAALGIHGVMSYVVTQRTSEIGIRMALGADGIRIVGLIGSRAAALIGLGLTGGLLGASVVSRSLHSLLFGVGPVDAPVYGIAAGLVALCGATACLVPVRRATRVDPLRAIRMS